MRNVFAGNDPASGLRERFLVEEQMYGDNITKLIRTIDTHDTASDIGLDRNEITMTSKGVEAALVITNTFDGVPFLWNGYEVCDNAENNMFSNRFYGRRSAMNWSRAFTADGIRRKNTYTEATLKLDKKPGNAILSSGAEMCDNSYKLDPYGYCIVELV